MSAGECWSLLISFWPLLTASPSTDNTFLLCDSYFIHASLIVDIILTFYPLLCCWRLLFLLNCLFLCCPSIELASSPKNWKVYGGVVSQDSLPQPYLVEKIIVNENYDSQTNDQDIALLKLTAAVVFNGQSRLCFIQIVLHLHFTFVPQMTVFISCTLLIKLFWKLHH